MKKRIVTLLLALSLLLSLGLTAGAASVVPSPQKLIVDGKTIECEKYNIDGSNYFKLRDLALLLRTTGSCFSVDWDAENSVVSLTTGAVYLSDGSELVLSGDHSASAVKSSQKIMIDGELRTDLSVYNIGGSNYFKLRELGAALGFDVYYDRDQNTSLVISRAWTERPAVPAAELSTELFDIILKVPKSGEKNSYVELAVYNRSGSTLTLPAFIEVDGYLCFHYAEADVAKYTADTVRYDRAVTKLQQGEARYEDMPLDAASTGYAVVIWEDEYYYVEYGTQGVSSCRRGDADGNTD